MNEQNPYTPPNSDVINEQDNLEFRLTAPRSVGIGAGFSWLGEGFSYFKSSAGGWILTLIVGFLVAVGLGLIPVLGQIASMLLTYVWMGGIMMGLKAQDEGKPFEVNYLFAGFKHNFGALVLLSVVTTIISVAIMGVAMGPIYFKLLTGANDPEVINQMATFEGFWGPLLLAMVLMIPLMLATIYAPALIAINDMPVLKAMQTSFMGGLKNFFTLLIFAIVAYLLLFLSMLPLLLGLFITVPMMFGAIYAGYKEIFIE